MRAAAVVLAAGSGTRVGADRNKVLLPLAGEPILSHSLRTASQVPGVVRVVLVVRPGDPLDEVADRLGDREVWVVEGGGTRHDSEQAALAVLRPSIEDGSIDVVALHDAARPLASAELWERVLTTAEAHGGAVPGIPLPGLLGPGARDGLVAVQTPQAFRAAPLLEAYDAADAAGPDNPGSPDDSAFTDTAATVAAYADLEVVAVLGEPANLKVTFADDVQIAERLISRAPRPR